jgi:CHAD domain-containing protein
MSYRIVKSDRTVADAVRRIALEQVNGAETLLISADRTGPTSIHGLRKHIKRLRGLIRLVRPGFSQFTAENTRLRDLGRSLADLRDSDVLLMTLDGLSTSDNDFPHLRKALVTSAGTLRDPAATARGLDNAETGFRSLRQRVTDWKIERRGFETAAKGLKRSHEAAQKTLENARKDPSDEQIHDWRKRVKDTHYQMALLEHLWPEAMTPRISATDELGEMLGVHHDLSVLISRLGRLGVPEAEVSAVTAVARSRQDQIMAKALPLGARLYAGDARAMADLWAQWWQIWKDQN